MGETIVKILLAGMNIFSEERKRHFQKELKEVGQAVLDAENARHPDYSDAKLAMAIEARELFLVAYAAEFSARMDELRAATGGTGGVTNA